MKRQLSDNHEERTKAKATGSFAARGARVSRSLRFPITSNLSGSPAPSNGFPAATGASPTGLDIFEHKLHSPAGEEPFVDHAEDKAGVWASLAEADEVAAALAACAQNMRAALEGQLGYAGHPATSAAAASSVATAATRTAAAAAGLAALVAKLEAEKYAIAAQEAFIAAHDLSDIDMSSATVKQWFDATVPHMAPLQYLQALHLYRELLRNLKVKEHTPSHTFEPHDATGSGAPPLTGTQHTQLNLDLPHGDAAHILRKCIHYGHVHTSYDEESKARVVAELTLVGEDGGAQHVQLQLHGSIPGVLGGSKAQQDGTAVTKLKKHMCGMVASVMLWMFRTEGVLEEEAWGRLRSVRPATGQRAGHQRLRAAAWAAAFPTRSPADTPSSD